MLTELNRNEGVVIGRTLKNFEKTKIENTEIVEWRNGEIILNEDIKQNSHPEWLFPIYF